MTAVATAWTIDGTDEAKMRVSRENGTVEFRWLCGDRRTMSVAEVEQAIANLELCAPHGVWLRLHGRGGSGSFVAMVADGRFYAAATPTEDPDQYVSWPTLRDLLQPPATDDVDEAQEVEPEPPSSRFIVKDRQGGLRGWLQERFGA